MALIAASPLPGTTRAAAYVRKSTDQSDRDERDKSITVQKEGVRIYATRQDHCGGGGFRSRGRTGEGPPADPRCSGSEGPGRVRGRRPAVRLLERPGDPPRATRRPTPPAGVRRAGHQGRGGDGRPENF